MKHTKGKRLYTLLLFIVRSSEIECNGGMCVDVDWTVWIDVYLGRGRKGMPDRKRGKYDGN